MSGIVEKLYYYTLSFKMLVYTNVLSDRSTCKRRCFSIRYAREEYPRKYVFSVNTNTRIKITFVEADRFIIVLIKHSHTYQVSILHKIIYL